MREILIRSATAIHPPCPRLPFRLHTSSLADRERAWTSPSLRSFWQVPMLPNWLIETRTVGAGVELWLATGYTKADTVCREAGQRLSNIHHNTSHKAEPGLPPNQKIHPAPLSYATCSTTWWEGSRPSNRFLFLVKQLPNHSDGDIVDDTPLVQGRCLGKPASVERDE